MSFYLLRKTIRRLPGIVIKAVPLPKPEITEGFGVREKVGRLCRERGCRSVLLAVDRTLYELGLSRSIEDALRENGIRFTLFSDIASEPTAALVAEGRRAAVRCGADCVVALGGGSVLDSAKIIAASARKPKRAIGHYLVKFVFCDTLPIIAVPSTAGTGAELTVGAVVKNRLGMKLSTVLVGLNVEEVILDSELTVGMPWRLTAACGIDALSHGLEGCMADVRVSREDAERSRECVRLVLENLPALAAEPGDVERRRKLFLAANYGGNAINRQLAGYVHAFAHVLGSQYHVSHGEAIARCLLPVVRLLEPDCRGPLRELSVYCGCAAETDAPDIAAAKLLERIEELLRDCGLTEGFPELREKDFRMLIREISRDAANYSPVRILTDAELRAVLDGMRTS